ncbi:Holliday junction resolvase RuvX [Patescibacteria group bacterium]|nr:Holliday junction resolvase RuvX [Patescibacteria group bacterium]MBU1895797.1 Holliday junction resolvase RuvX [Patescibacteria group bacterium]
MNILGIDYGKKRIGLAWVDTDLGVVLPFGQFQTSDFRLQIGELVEKEKVDKIVIGLPIGLDGKENENTKSVQVFVEELKEQIDLPIEFVDERFSSRQADAMGGTVSRDEKSAMVILSSYLEQSKQSK